MTPLQAIARWFSQQTPELQDEIAEGVFPSLFCDSVSPLPDDEAQVRQLNEWLNSAVGRHQVLGRFLAFKANFEFHFGSWFKAAGWRARENYHRYVVEAAARDPAWDQAQLAGTSQAFLTDLPQRRAAWKNVGRTWRSMMAAFSDKDVHDWNSVVESTARESYWTG